MSLKQTSVVAADYSSAADRTRRSYVDHSWQSWTPGAWDQQIMYDAGIRSQYAVQHLKYLYTGALLNVWPQL